MGDVTAEKTAGVVPVTTIRIEPDGDRPPDLSTNAPTGWTHFPHLYPGASTGTFVRDTEKCMDALDRGESVIRIYQPYVWKYKYHDCWKAYLREAMELSEKEPCYVVHTLEARPQLYDEHTKAYRQACLIRGYTPKIHILQVEEP